LQIAIKIKKCLYYKSQNLRHNIISYNFTAVHGVQEPEYRSRLRKESTFFSLGGAGLGREWTFLTGTGPGARVIFK